MIDRNPEEFKSKTGVVTVDTPSGKQQVSVISYHGVIRASMLTEDPRGPEFRDWAKTVLFEVMTKGVYVDPALASQFNLPVLQQILNQLNETVLPQGRMVQNLAAEVAKMREWRSQTLVPAQADNSEFHSRAPAGNANLTPRWDVYPGRPYVRIISLAPTGAVSLLSEKGGLALIVRLCPQ